MNVSTMELTGEWRCRSCRRLIMKVEKLPLFGGRLEHKCRCHTFNEINLSMPPGFSVVALDTSDAVTVTSR